MNRPNQNLDWDGIRAGNTLRWIDNSGPRYAEVTGALAGVTNEAAFLDVDGKRLALRRDRISFASWQIANTMAPGTTVTFKVRSDPVWRSK